MALLKLIGASGWRFTLVNYFILLAASYGALAADSTVRTLPTGIAVIEKQGIFDVALNVKVIEHKASASEIGLLNNKGVQGKEAFRPPSPAHQNSERLPPKVAPTTLEPPDPVLSWGFDGMTNFDQTECGIADYYLSQTSVEPADVSLCVGNGRVVQVLNSAIIVYDVNGTRLMPPIPLAQFFLLPAGNSYVTEPKCIYDGETDRFVIIGVGEIDQRMNLVISVSNTGNPMEKHHIYSLPTVGDGKDARWPKIDGCPCVINEPNLGADRFGIYITTDQYTSSKAHAFVGAQIYALPKVKFAAGPSIIDVTYFKNVHFDDDTRVYALQPSSTPSFQRQATATSGVEYFLGTVSGGRIAVWALVNTLSLADRALRNGIQLISKVIDTASFVQPPYADQRDGERPLGALAQGYRDGPALVEVLDTGDTRTTKTYFADGKLWTAISTAVSYDLPVPTSKADEWTEKMKTRVGFLWLCIQPNITAEFKGGPMILLPTVVNQGYVAVLGQNVIYPTLAVNSDGRGAVTFTLVGPDYFPSVGYAPISARGSGKVHIISPGMEPQDGFSGYLSAGGSEEGVSRWGETSASAVDEAGNVWMSTQYSPGSIRTIAANWGTFITRLQPPFFT